MGEFDLQFEKDEDPEGVIQKANDLHVQINDHLLAVLTAWESNEGDLSEVEGILAKLKYTTNLIEGH